MNENTKPRDRALKSSVIQMKKMTSLQKEFVISIGNCLGNHSEDLKTIRIPIWREISKPNKINDSFTKFFFPQKTTNIKWIISNSSSQTAFKNKHSAKLKTTSPQQTPNSNKTPAQQ